MLPKINFIFLLLVKDLARYLWQDPIDGSSASVGIKVLKKIVKKLVVSGVHADDATGENVDPGSIQSYFPAYCKQIFALHATESPSLELIKTGWTKLHEIKSVFHEKKYFCSLISLPILLTVDYGNITAVHAEDTKDFFLYLGRIKMSCDSHQLAE